MASANVSHVQAQTLGGTSGLVTIPAAPIADDGEITAGVHRLHRAYPHLFGPEGANVYYASVGFLPSLEVTLRLTRPHQGQPALGDRMVSIRAQLLSEKNVRPALAVGLRDPLGTRRFHAAYTVASKHLAIPAVPLKAGLHIGYGTRLWDQPSYWTSSQLLGLFGGLSLRPSSWVALFVDHSSQAFTSGIRISLFNDHLKLITALHERWSFSGGISLSLSL